MDFERVMEQAGYDLGWHEHNMRRNRPYNGQPHTSTGQRGATEVTGITFRDLRDAFIRAYVQSHEVYKPGTIEEVQPNAALHREAEKGENATICEDDVYKLKGTIDPIALAQNLSCEIEKLMGIYPNVPKLTFTSESSGDGDSA